MKHHRRRRRRSKREPVVAMKRNACTSAWHSRFRCLSLGSFILPVFINCSLGLEEGGGAGGGAGGGGPGGRGRSKRKRATKCWVTIECGSQSITSFHPSRQICQLPHVFNESQPIGQHPRESLYNGLTNCSDQLLHDANNREDVVQFRRQSTRIT